MQALKRFLRDEKGPTATEYAVMLALMIVTTLAAIQTLGRTVNSAFMSANVEVRSVAS